MTYAAQTTVPLERSIAEIIGLLRKAGAERIMQFEEPERFTVSFQLAGRLIQFRIPMATEYEGPTGHRNGAKIDRQKWIDQRNRQKGRALMLVVKAKLESVESAVETFEEAFLANIVLSDGWTVYERIAQPIALEYESGKVAPLQLSGPSRGD